MTLLTAALVTLVVWAVSLVRSVRLRALIYSLPLPITVVLVTTRIAVSAQQLLGVVLLNVFLTVVAWLHQRAGWPIMLADLAGVAAYVAGSWALLHAGRVPFVPTLAAVLIAWVVAVALGRRVRPRSRTAAARRTLPVLAKLLVIGLGALVTVGLGQLLRGLVVTFPYSGVLVVVETRRDLAEFRAHFTRNSLALLAFLTAYRLTQDGSRYLAVAAGWVAFLACALLLHLARRGATAARPSTVDS